MIYLNCHTWHSLRYGTFSEEDLCVLACKKGVKTLALTDINSTTACLNFCRIAPKFGIKPLIGVDFRNNNHRCYTGIAKSRDGYQALNDFLSAHLHAKKDFPADAPPLKDCYFIYPFSTVSPHHKTRFRSDEYIGISVETIRKLRFSLYKSFDGKLVFQQPVSVRHKKDYNAHRLLRAIDLNIVLSRLPQHQQAGPGDKMYDGEVLTTAFADYEFIFENTRQLAQRCVVQFDFGKKLNKNLRVFSESKSDDARRLRRLVKTRFRRRYPHPDVKTLKRTAKELNAIIKLGFVSYFLINLDIITYAKSQNYPFIGRGSGANSIVAYILGITNVDPIELDLYFERFINPNRSSPPDFDIDFSWKDRDDVTRYIFQRYENTALMGTYVTFKRRAVARELGKVFGLPKTNIDKLASGHFAYHQLDQLEKLVVNYSRYIKGFPNYRSVHSGGILILDEPVHNFSATFLPPKNFRTIQIDMHIAEEVGIHKFDILAQRGLPKITEALTLIHENQPEATVTDLEKVDCFKADPHINAMLKNGDCMGVFYVESPAMRGLLTKLQTDNYLNLVAASSIIRPGVSNGGMKEEYIKRHRMPEKRREAHPVLYDIMPETYGVMVYQEDVMKVAHYFAGLDLDDADVLRRGMSGKKTGRGQMQKIEQKFRYNCAEKGYSSDLIDEVWAQIASFAGYAFPKGHSASYAVESYQSLYLKCYFPLEFMVAVLNNGGGFYATETYIQEIRNCGGTVEAPDINKSAFEATIMGKTVYLGLGYLRDINHKTVKDILENRNFFGRFYGLEDFLDRIDISIGQIQILIRINAFRFTGINKHTLLWKALFFLQKNNTVSAQHKLFKPPRQRVDLPHFETSERINAFDQIELLGFHLIHPFKLLTSPLKSKHTVSDFKKHVGRHLCIYGYLICLKKTKTSRGQLMYFGTFYDYNFQVFDTVHFPIVAKHYPVKGKGIYRCSGKVTNEHGYYSLQLTALLKMPIKTDPRFDDSLNS